MGRGEGTTARGDGAEGRGGVEGRAAGVGGLGTNLSFMARADLPDFFFICTEKDKNNSFRRKQAQKHAILPNNWLRQNIQKILLPHTFGKNPAQKMP